MTELEPVARIDPEALKELEKWPTASATVWSGKASHRFSEAAEPLITLSSAQSAIAERDARIAELSELAKTFEAEANQMCEVSIMNRHRAEAAEALLSKLISYVPEECFEGDTRWELVECKRSGGAWFGAEDFRAARSLMSKIGERNGE